MITAYEAFLQSHKNMSREVQVQLDMIEDNIKVAIEDGAFSFEYPFPLRQKTKETLIDNGYKIVDLDNKMTMISWNMNTKE